MGQNFSTLKPPIHSLESLVLYPTWGIAPAQSLTHSLSYMGYHQPKVDLHTECSRQSAYSGHKLI